MGKRVQQINNLVIEQGTTGAVAGKYIVKAPDGTIMQVCNALIEAQTCCKACTRFIGKRNSGTTVPATPAVVIRGGTELSTDAIVCKSRAAAVQFIKKEMHENEGAGDHVVECPESLQGCSAVVQVFDGVRYATISRAGSIQWWVLVDNVYTTKG